MLRQHNIGV